MTAPLAAAGAILLAAAHGVGLPLFNSIEGTTLDWRFRLRGTVQAPTEVAIIAIDERTLAEIGRWPLPRSVIAAAIDHLREAGAGSIGLDLLLTEPETPGEGAIPAYGNGDLALRDALSRHGRDVLAMAALFERSAAMNQASRHDLTRLGYRVVARPAVGAIEPPRAAGALLPIELLREVAAVGHVNLLLGETGVPRAYHPAIAIDDVLVPSFSVQLARQQLGIEEGDVSLSLEGTLRLGDRTVLLDNSLGAPLDYYGPVGSITTYSFADLMRGTIPVGALGGRAILLGGTAIGIGDSFATPFAGALPGVEVLATAVANLLQEDRLLRTGEMRRWEAIAVIVLACLAWVTTNLPGPRQALFLTLALFMLWPIAAHVAFLRWHLWLNVVVPSFATVMTGAIVTLGRVAEELRLRRETERQRGNLARYVSPVMAEQLATEDKPSFDEREQLAAILFVDLSGFTQASEAQSPGDTARFLKEFHTRLEQVVLAHGGVIEQFAGDGAMVIFGLPQPGAQDPVSALACARALLTELARWQSALKPRAGLHFGPVAMARLGGKAQAQLAAAGDTVNVASRLEAFARQRGAALAVSDATVAAVRAAGRAELLAGLERWPDQSIRGREGRLTVWLASIDRLMTW
jgi:adenylate cyclase